MDLASAYAQIEPVLRDLTHRREIPETVETDELRTVLTDKILSLRLIAVPSVAYLKTALRRAAYDYWRKKKDFQEAVDRESLCPSLDAVEASIDASTVHRVALDVLTVFEFQVFSHRHPAVGDAWTFDQIAQSLSTYRTAAQAGYNRAIRKLRVRFGVDE